jgi:hypothetical protein
MGIGTRKAEKNLLDRNESRTGVGDGQANARRRSEWPTVLVAEAAHAGADGLLADLELEFQLAAAYGHGGHVESETVRDVLQVYVSDGWGERERTGGD